MSEPFLGEMRFVAFDFAPSGWMLCAGQSLRVNDHQALFQMLGTTYGGDGRQTFNLPDLRGRVPVGQGPRGGYAIGNIGGEERHMLTQAEVPGHTHALQGSPGRTAVGPPAGNLLASTATIYAAPGTLVNLHPGSVAPVGGTPHENRQPYTVLNVIIAVRGLTPSRN